MLALRNAVSRSSVDDFCAIWSKSAEEGLFRAYSRAGGPTEAGNAAFLSGGLSRIRNRRLGGRAVGSRRSSRVYRASQGDEVNVHRVQYYVNSSLAPVVLFRRRLKSVADVLKGIRSRGFTQSRWDALKGYWEAVCRHGPCGPISFVRPWDTWIHLDLHGFYKWVFDSLGLLNDFHRQVVVSRRDFGIRKCGFGRIQVLGRMLGLGLISFPLPLFLLSGILRRSHLGSEMSLILLMLFRKAWMPFFCRSGHPVVSADQFLDFVGHLLRQEPFLDLPRLTGRDLQEVVRAEKVYCRRVGWVGPERAHGTPVTLVPWSGCSFGIG